jgi:YgiT-type zinc finger domain-containing protein
MKNEKCPICGKNLLLKNGDIAFPTKTGKVTVTDLDYQECGSCHEKVFSQDAQEKIELTVYGKKQKKVS